MQHQYKYIHHGIGYNYRLSNINAALGCAQLEKLKKIISSQRKLFTKYNKVFNNLENIEILREPKNSQSNYWLQTIVLDKKKSSEKNIILRELHKAKIFSRPAWKLISELKPYKNCLKMDLAGAKEIYNRIINIPSSQEIYLKKI